MEVIGLFDLTVALKLVEVKSKIGMKLWAIIVGNRLKCQHSFLAVIPRRQCRDGVLPITVFARNTDNHGAILGEPSVVSVLVS